MKIRLPAIAMSAAAIAMLLAGCGTKSDTPEDPTTPEAEEVEVVDEDEPADIADDDGDVDFSAIDRADSDLQALIFRAQEAEEEDRDELLPQIEKDLNALTDEVVRAMRISVATLDFEQIGDADVSAWSLFDKAKKAGEFIDVTPAVEKLVKGLDQARTTLETTADPNDQDELDIALEGLDSLIENAQEYLDSNA